MEDIFRKTGECGKFQGVIFNLLSFSVVKSAFDIVSLVFFLHQPDYTCNVAGSVNLTALNISDSAVQNVCELRVSPAIAGQNASSNPHNIACESYTYDNKVMSRTVTTEFDMICEQSFYPPLIQSAYFIGALLGMLCAIVGDRVGRQSVLMTYAIVDILTTALTLAMNDVVSQTVSRFLKGLASGIYYQSFVLLCELIGNRHRALLANAFWFYWPVGHVLCAVSAYILRDWRAITYVSLVMSLVYILYFYYIPESVRWLLLKGRKLEAKVLITAIAKSNNKKDADEISITSDAVVKSRAVGRPRALFAHAKVRNRALVIWYTVWALSLCYFGLSLNTKLISSDIFLSSLVSGACELPAALVGWLLSDRIGRRIPSGALSLVAGVLAMVAAVIPTIALSALRVSVAMLAKTLLVASFGIIHLMAAEAFPTSHRNLVLFVGGAVGCVAQIVALCLQLWWIEAWIPPLAYGLSLVSSGALLLFVIPETRAEKNMPDTMADAAGLRLRSTVAARKRPEDATMADAEAPQTIELMSV